MTENEAINELQTNIDLPFGSTVSDEASEIAIQALEEVRQYRAIIGLTIDDLKALEKDEVQTIGDALKIFSEWHKYRAIGTVEDVEFYKKCYDEESYEYCGEYGTDTCGCKRRMEHLEKKVAEIDAIGTIEEFKALKEKKPISKNGISICPMCGVLLRSET